MFIGKKNSFDDINNGSHGIREQSFCPKSMGVLIEGSRKNIGLIALMLDEEMNLSSRKKEDWLREMEKVLTKK